MFNSYIINCGGFNLVPPICGYAVWGNIEGEITNQTDLIQYLIENYQPLNDWLTDISDLQLEGEPGDIFFVNEANEIDRLPIGPETYVPASIGGFLTYISPSQLLSYGSLGDLSDVDIDILQEGDLLRYVDGVWQNITLGMLLQDINLVDLADVNVGVLNNGDILQWNGTAFVDVSISQLADQLSGQLSLDDLSNVSSADSATTGHILRKTAGDWQAASPATVAGSINLSDLGDVTITAPSAGHIITRNPGNTGWINQAPSVPSGLGSDDVENDSTVNGGSGTVSDALDNLQGQIDNIDSGGGVAENLKYLRGSISNTGTIRRGAGFSVNKLGAGEYDVSFTTPVGSDAVVVITTGTDTAGGSFPLTSCAYSPNGNGLPGSNGFCLYTYRWKGAPTEWEQEDVGFDFLVITT